MKHHQFFAFGAWALALAFVPSVAEADRPEAPAAKPPERSPKPGARPSELFGKPDGKPEPGAKGDHGKGDGKPEAAGDHGKGDGKPEAAGADEKPGAGPKSDHRNEGFRNGMRDLHEQLKAGTLKKEDLKAQLAKLHENSAERGKLHRQELGKRWGGALALPAAREELKHHARRMAFLNRAMLLAETEITKDKDKVSQRITKLIEKENERHQRAMENMKSAPGTPAPSAASAAPAASDAKGAVK